MNSSVVINVENINKSFKIPHERITSLKAATLNLFKHKSYTKHVAAREISFEVKKGEFLGIIGRNGCGKSTMLKMLAGIYVPDSGKITIDGTLSPFLELGVGFNPELSARDNIYLNGTILGLSRRQIDAIFDDVVNFSELHEFIDMKLKNFSSGMQVRLAFSVAINAHADTLLIDEVLAVGDVNFQKKCFDTFKRFKDEGRTIVFVSHDMNSIRSFCDRVIVLGDGKKLFDGETDKGIDLYKSLNDADSRQGQISENAESIGSHNAEITDIKVYNHLEKQTKTLETGKQFMITFCVLFKRETSNPSFGVIFRPDTVTNLLGIHTYYRDNKIEIGRVKNGDKIQVTISGKLPINAGIYNLTFKVAEKEETGNNEIMQMLNNYMVITVKDESPTWGLIKNDIDIKPRKK